MFVTFEGGEGVGKSSLIKNIIEILEQRNIDYVSTREPGGTKKSEEIREKLLSDENLSDEQRVDLFVEARIDHNKKIITPALNDNKIVISDRYFDSTFVYQGLFIDLNKFEMVVNKNINNDIQIPTLTFILDLDPKISMERLSKNNRTMNFIDKLPLSYHQKIRQSYLDLPKYKTEIFGEVFKNNKTIVIDMNRSNDEILNDILSFML